VIGVSKRKKAVTVMSPPVQVPDSQRLRERAVECRSLAELFRARAARNHLLEIAADYDHLSMKAAALELVDADRQGTHRYLTRSGRLLVGR
jgi:hypothetical protein